MAGRGSDIGDKTKQKRPTMDGAMSIVSSMIPPPDGSDDDGDASSEEWDG